MWGRASGVKGGRIFGRVPGGSPPAGVSPDEDVVPSAESRTAVARVIAVTSGKGGVGKSNLTVNLGLALAALNQQVIILDADLGLANVEVLLGISPPCTLYDCLYRDRDIREVLVPAPGGVQFISGGSGFLELANLDRARWQRLLASLTLLDNLADFILIDTGAGLSKNVLGFLAAAGEVIVVLTPEPTSLMDGYSLIKVLARFKVHREVLLVVNRAGSEQEARATVRRVEMAADRFLGLPVVYLGAINEDRAVIRAVRNQRPFYLAEPRSQPARSVAAMARCLTGGGSREEPPRPGLRGFVQRLARLFDR
ncbi:MinD/ParA family protein [Desulfofundulus sp. TPOSR]|uniref:MinD/ParA family protein n=1 Tax=Desulfofundulus sp. TPOSR TaxID=2714340 RepID=UPI001A9BC883|nr:MinD/ParA family protein [Desulfofundulus sp. TPOSR]